MLLGGSPLAIFIAIIITFGVPVFLHLVFYRAAASPPSCNFLLLGPSGAGKTAFTTLVGYSPNLGEIFRYSNWYLAAGRKVLAGFKEVASYPHFAGIDAGRRHLAAYGSHCLESVSLRQRPFVERGLAEPN